MCYVTAITFDCPSEAAKVPERLYSTHHAGCHSPDGSAVVVRDEEAAAHARNEMDREFKIGSHAGRDWGYREPIPGWSGS